jgi:hypothetical protein
LIEAHLVQQLLAAESICSTVFNENAHGAAGELPITDVWPEVWIEDNNHAALARLIIENYETTIVTEQHQPCASCGEPNPTNFGLCWHCGLVLDKVVV